MTPRQFHRLLVAPEIIVVDLAESALIALDRALRVEHPLVDAPPPEHVHVNRWSTVQGNRWTTGKR
jgi:hypothetical protein